MYEGLQEGRRGRGKISPASGSTAVILNGDYADEVCRYIEEATTEIRICAYAWRWYENEPTLGIQKINIAILRALARGVVVRAIVDAESVAFRLKARGLTVRYVLKTEMMHAKAFCIDDTYLILGSHNLTKRALRSNYEASMVTNLYEPILQFSMFFDTLWEVCYEG